MTENVYPANAAWDLLSTVSAPLTVRQSQVLQMLCEGLSSKQMAVRLGLSVKTIEMHRAGLHQRMGTRRTPHLLRRLIQRQAALMSATNPCAPAYTVQQPTDERPPCNDPASPCS